MLDTLHSFNIHVVAYEIDNVTHTVQENIAQSSRAYMCKHSYCCRIWFSCFQSTNRVHCTWSASHECPSISLQLSQKCCWQFRQNHQLPATRSLALPWHFIHRRSIATAFSLPPSMPCKQRSVRRQFTHAGDPVFLRTTSAALALLLILQHDRHWTSFWQALSRLGSSHCSMSVWTTVWLKKIMVAID